MANQKIAVVTGSSSGIGLETAIELAKNGFKTYATMRNTNKSDEIQQRSQSENLPVEIVQLDVNDDASVNNAINTIIEKEGQIDVLVNNAGFATVGAAEEVSIDEIKNQFETNVFGVIRTIQAVLPVMKKQDQGRIINISSGAAFVGTPWMSAYNSSKGALESFTETLRKEVATFGIKVSLVQPGLTKTNGVHAMKVAKKSQDPNSSYAELAANTQKTMEKMMENADPPKVVANEILKAATDDDPAIRYTAGSVATQLLQARQSKSDPEFEKFLQELFT